MLRGSRTTLGCLCFSAVSIVRPHPDNAITEAHIATMLASGFTNAPVTKALVVGVVLTSFLASVTDTKYFIWIEVRPHLFDYWQFWRLITWQLCYTNSTEVLFAAMTFYQMRVIERLWGSRKFAVGRHEHNTTAGQGRLTGG